MLVGSHGFAPVKLDAGHNLIGVCGVVAQRRVHLGACKRRTLDEGRERIGLLGEILDPHRDLPDIGTAEQSRSASGWAVAEHDQRMLLTNSAFLGIATQTIRKRLTGGARS